MKMRFALAALTAATLSTMAYAQMGPGAGGGPGMGQGRGPGMGPGGDCPMQQGGPQGKGGMGGQHGGKMGQGGHHGGMMGEGGMGRHHGGPMGEGGRMGGGMMGRHGGMMGEGGPGGPGMKAVMALDLNADQRTKITEIQRDAQRKHHGFMGTMREMRWKAQDAQKDGFNEDAARRQYDAMAAIRKEIFEAGLATRKQVDAVLTPAQREKLKAKSHPA